MTDKEKTVVDGVDVSGCRYYSAEHKLDFSNCGHICEGTECKYKRLWYKKQLKRKEQECEELKRKVELMMDCPDCKVDEYKKALEEIEQHCNEQNLKYDTTACEILTIINKAKDGNK